MQYPAQQQQYGGMSRPAYQAGGWNNRVRPVSSIDEVRAASIDFDGSVFYFPDLANKKIYTKQIQMDGSLAFNVYELKDIVIPPKEEIKQKEYVTRDEFNELLVLLKENINKESLSKEKLEEIIQKF